MKPASLLPSALTLLLLGVSFSAQQGTLTILNTALASGNVGSSYSQTLQATGGLPPYSWSSSGTMPAGLYLNPVGTLSGSPTTAGNYTFTLNVVDANRASASKIFGVTVAAAVVHISISTTSLNTGTVGTAYSATLSGSGGTLPYTWSVGQGFPLFFSIDPNTGIISGTPTTAGTFSFPVQLTDAAHNTATRTVSVTINPSPLIITTLPPIFNGTVGMSYVQTFRATGGTAPYTWSILSGSTGDLSLDSASGNLQGTPLTAGTLNFTIQVIDASRQITSQSYSLLINTPTLAITLGSALPAGTVGVSYSQRIAVTATGGLSPYIWSIAPGSALPPGLLFTPSTLTLSGTPTTAGTFSFNIAVQDAASTLVSRAIGMTISSPPLSLTTSRQFPDGILNQAYSAIVAATGGQPPYRWTATGLPSGVTINTTTGQISGTPTAAGNFAVAITVTDSALANLSDRFTLNINLPSAPDATLSGLPASVGPAQQFQIQVTTDSPFPAPITGQAILTFAPDSGPTDRTIQFASGGTTASFNIPAGSTANDAPISLQTGTVSGTISISLRLQAGGIDITPNPAPTITAQLARAAPVIRSVTVNRRGSTLNVVVTGYSTAREVTQAVFGFSAASGQSLQPSASSITIDAATMFGNWFLDSNNSQFGSVFVLTQPFTITGDVNSVIPTSVSLTNRVGSVTSNVSP